MCPTYSNTSLSIHDIIRMLRDNRGLIIKTLCTSLLCGISPEPRPSAKWFCSKTQNPSGQTPQCRSQGNGLPIKLGNRTPLGHQINSGVALLPKQVCQERQSSSLSMLAPLGKRIVVWRLSPFAFLLWQTLPLSAKIAIFVVVFGSNLADSTALWSIFQYRNLLRDMASLRGQHEIIATSVR